MRRFVSLFGCVFVVVAMTASCGGPRLGEFGALTGAETTPGGEPTRTAYKTLVSYYGYIEPGSEPDGTVENKPFRYLYVWMPVAVPELGVRMMSPVRDWSIPAADDFMMSTWERGRTDYDNYFDTFITFERSTIIAPENIREALRSDWTRIAENDDSDEMPSQPSGRRHNSLLRVTDRSKLLRGLYRIGFTTAKEGEVHGTFLLQIGTTAESLPAPGLLIARTPQELIQLLQAGQGAGPTN